MQTIPRRRCLALLGAMAASVPLLGTSIARAQSYPSRPITLIVPWPPGGPTDICARLTADVISASLKQPVIVENRSGATGNIGAQAVARAEPDGYTLMLTLDSALTANPFVYGERRMGFDPQRDLVAITTQVEFSLMLAVHPSTGIRNFKEFVERARKGANYSSAGIASPGHLTMEAVNAQIAGQLNHIPYRGNAPATNAVLSGEVQAGFIATPGLLPQVEAGKVTALAVSGDQRSALAANVPTVAEHGYPDATAEFTFVLMAPRGTPQTIVDLWNTQMRQALTDEGVRKRLRALDMEPVGDSPAQAAARLEAGRERWGKLVKERNIQPGQ